MRYCAEISRCFGLLCCTALSLGACAPVQPAVQTQTVPAQPVRVLDGPQAPLVSRLEGPPSVPAHGEIELVLRVERPQPGLAPLQVVLSLPAGVELASGRDREEVLDTAAQPLERRWRVRYAALPTQDAEVQVSWRTAAAGYQVALPYRFGRPEPKLVQQQRLPEVHLLGGKSLGQPILTTPSAH